MKPSNYKAVQQIARPFPHQTSRNLRRFFERDRGISFVLYVTRSKRYLVFFFFFFFFAG